MSIGDLRIAEPGAVGVDDAELDQRGVEAAVFRMKISRHIMALTIVGTAQGRKIRMRRAPRPRKLQVEEERDGNGEDRLKPDRRAGKIERPPQRIDEIGVGERPADNSPGRSNRTTCGLEVISLSVKLSQTVSKSGAKVTAASMMQGRRKKQPRFSASDRQPPIAQVLCGCCRPVNGCAPRASPLRQAPAAGSASPSSAEWM